ncbi:hypothetical protein BDQ17DRAFT_534657 [Cyathus striatus]|nr:hypothetical protein BDQ17DRAFT_534657 [Cyathus striatus]
MCNITFSKLSERDAEISQLRQELDRYSLGSSTRTANPLPAPPEPVSLDHLPSLYQALIGGSSSFSPALAHNLNGHSPSSTHPLQTITNGSGSSKELYLGGYVPHPHVNGENSGATPPQRIIKPPHDEIRGRGRNDTLAYPTSTAHLPPTYENASMVGSSQARRPAIG